MLGLEALVRPPTGPLVQRPGSYGTYQRCVLSCWHGARDAEPGPDHHAITVLTTVHAGVPRPLFIVATRTGGGREVNGAVHEYSDRLPQVLTRLIELERYARVSRKPVIALVDLKWD